MNKLRIIGCRVGIYLLCCAFISKLAEGTMTLSGPISASSVAVNGDVTMSSVTVSTLTVSGLLNVTTAATIAVSSRIFQVLFSSITPLSATSTSTTTWTSVTGLAKSISLGNANNSIRISVSGNLKSFNITPGYITVNRDSTNLGDPTNGLAGAITNSGGAPNTSVGITIMDSPGDTMAHTYQVYIRAAPAPGPNVIFSWNCPGSLLLEEIGR